VVRREGAKAVTAQPPNPPPDRPISRRKLLFASGGTMLLGVGASVSAKDAGLPAALLRAGRSGQPTAGASPAAAGSAAASAAAPSGDAAGLPSSPPIEVAPATPPQPRLAAAPQYYIDDAGPDAIALTFDDGPHPLYTPQVLEILDQYGVQATFNMIGRQIGENLSLVREVSAAGHVITNHTWDHADMRAYPLARVLSEVDRCNDALAEAGQHPTIFRAPFGYWTPGVFQACADRNLTPLGWSVDPQDWNTGRVTVNDIVRTVLDTTNRHDIVLEHDGGGDRANTVAALRIFLPALLERGFVFAAV
jgi:peptidoglycan/xylan/chitin deacetylase (PgdA/CDA1 family)